MPRAREGFRCAGGAGSWLRAEIGSDTVDAAEERRRAKREKRRKKKEKTASPSVCRFDDANSIRGAGRRKLSNVCETRLSNSFFTRFLVSRDPLPRSLPRGANEDLVARGRFLAVRSGWRNRARRTRRPRSAADWLCAPGRVALSSTSRNLPNLNCGSVSLFQTLSSNPALQRSFTDLCEISCGISPGKRGISCKAVRQAL